MNPSAQEQKYKQIADKKAPQFHWCPLIRFFDLTTEELFKQNTQ